MAYIMATLDDESSDYVSVSSTVLQGAVLAYVGGGTRGHWGHLLL